MRRINPAETTVPVLTVLVVCLLGLFSGVVGFGESPVSGVDVVE